MTKRGHDAVCCQPAALSTVVETRACIDARPMGRISGGLRLLHAAQPCLQAVETALLGSTCQREARLLSGYAASTSGTSGCRGSDCTANTYGLRWVPIKVSQLLDVGLDRTLGLGKALVSYSSLCCQQNVGSASRSVGNVLIYRQRALAVYVGNNTSHHMPEGE